MPNTGEEEEKEETKMKMKIRRMIKTRAILKRIKEEAGEDSEEQEGEGEETGFFRKEQRISNCMIIDNLSIIYIHMNFKSLIQNYKAQELLNLDSDPHTPVNHSPEPTFSVPYFFDDD